MPDRPGWGTEPNEEGLRAHPPKGVGGLLNYGQKAQFDAECLRQCNGRVVRAATIPPNNRNSALSPWLMRVRRKSTIEAPRTNPATEVV